MSSAIGMPDATELLVAWEQGLHQGPMERALTLLAAATPGVAIEELASLPVGTRDANLFRLRSMVFGSRLVAIVTCPVCDEPIELSIDVPGMLESTRGNASAGDVTMVDLEGYELAFRNPATADLMGLGDAGSVEAARRKVLARCISSVHRDGRDIAIADLPETVIDAIGRIMSDRDPLADISLALVCPACNRDWTAPLDIAEFLWKELHAWARRTLREIHLLASGYGWRERDILALSPLRRQAYLELLLNE